MNERFDEAKHEIPRYGFQPVVDDEETERRLQSANFPKPSTRGNGDSDVEVTAR